MNPYSDLLNTAQRDLEASRVLHHAENYPAAVFYFQQAVEKACKFWGLSLEIITTEDIRPTIGHKPEKIFIKLFHKVIGKYDIVAISDYDKIEAILRGMPSKEDQVIHICGSISKVFHEPMYSPKEGQSDIDAITQNLRRHREAVRLHQLAERIESHEVEITPEIKQFAHALLMMNMGLMLFSFLVQNTEQNARYPDAEKSTTPESIYNKETLLIQLLPELLDYLQCLLDGLKHYFIDDYENIKIIAETQRGCLSYNC